MQQATETVSRSAQSQASSLAKSAGNINSSLDQSSQEIMKAAQQLQNQTVDSLNATLKAYDKSLVRIVGQLNATASRIENSTNKVPQVVSDAYNGMQKSFDIMARETAAMVRSMDQLRRALKSDAGV